MIRFALLFIFTAGLTYAERWLILPPRVELQNASVDAAALARAMALYLKASRVSEIISVTRTETCLKNANLSMAQKVAPGALRSVARDCMAERMLLTRVRMRDKKYEITSKTYYHESDMLTDTLVTRGPSLLASMGAHLTERFGHTPASPRESSADLIVVGDIFGGSYFDWLHVKDTLLSLDAVKTSYCLLDAKNRVQIFKPRAARSAQKEFFERLRFEGHGSYSDTDAMFHCAANAVSVAHNEGRTAQILLVVSDAPADSRSGIQVRAQMRSIARKAKITIVPVSTASNDTYTFWMKLAREMSASANFIPSAQRAKIGLAGGQEWYVFRRGGRIYESRDAEVERFEKGIEIPASYTSTSSLQDLTRLYESLSRNKVVSHGTAAVYTEPLRSKLLNIFKGGSQAAGEWRIMIEQDKVTYYVSLTGADARKLKVGEVARIFTELKPPTENQIVRNHLSPTIIIENSNDSAANLEINIADYMRAPGKYLRRSLGGRSFYVLTGKVLRVQSPEADSFDNAF
jgi:hypothetical protein